MLFVLQFTFFSSFFFLAVSGQEHNIGFLRSKAKSKHFIVEDVPQEMAERDKNFYFKVFKRASVGEMKMIAEYFLSRYSFFFISFN
jgi:hypothetical protein